jgi:hypothetical protein
MLTANKQGNVKNRLIRLQVRRLRCFNGHDDGKKWGRGGSPLAIPISRTIVFRLLVEFHV